MIIRRFKACNAAVLLLGLAAACESPSAPVAGAPPPPQVPQDAVVDRLDCTANPRLGTVACREAHGEGSARAATSVIIGGQGVNVRTVTANVAIVADTFAFDLRLVNLRPNPIGSLDGTTADPAGTKVFFSDTPPVSTTVGTGQVTVSNPDGMGTYTATNQPYYAYVQRLAANDTSAPKRWKLRFDPGVEQFSFHLLVQTSTGLLLHGVSAGAYDSCGLDPVGHVLCWGAPWSQIPFRELYTKVPTLVQLDSAAAQVAAGEAVCALTAGGHAFCWGSGFGGRQYNVPGGLTFVSLSVGGKTACGLDAQGKAYCWGKTDMGQLGNGTVTDSSSPQPGSGGLTFTQLSVGGGRVCGVAAGGSAYCWGNNDSGALGGPSTETCDNGTRTLPCSTTPVAVSGGVSFVSVSPPYFAPFTCGLTAAGAAYCWGNGDLGTLGRGVAGNAASPVPVAGGRVFSQVDAGIFHACALEAGTGTVYCWGLSYAFTPVPVPGNVRFTSISVVDHGCGVALDGRYYCWGENGYGQVGDGTTEYRGWPTKVALQF
jgi:alpha-tubulin suppressor-like RCC1 family protein